MNSQPEFYDQIIKYNDYYQNIEVQYALQDFLDSIPGPPKKTCCMCCGEYEKLLKIWGEESRIDYYADMPKIEKVNNFLKDNLEKTWPTGFEVENSWLKQTSWNFHGWANRFRLTYKTHVTNWDQNAEVMHVSYADHHNVWFNMGNP